jgi:hypothetical protein
VSFVEIERKVKYKTNDIIKNIYERVNLISFSRVQKNFKESSGKEKDGWQMPEHLPSAYEQSGIENGAETTEPSPGKPSAWVERRGEQVKHPCPVRYRQSKR